MIITISGDIGSGKSTTGRILCEKLDFKYLSTGAIQRQIASDMGMTTLELNHLTDSRLDIDEKIDSYTRALNDSTENYIVDSRLAWHFIPSSYKVFLLCEDHIAAERISKDKNRKSDESRRDVNHLLSKIKERRESERNRFKRIYNIDFQDLSNYNQIIDSAFFFPEQIADLIIEGSQFFFENK